MSDNKLTGTSLEVLSFMSSGIKKRTGSEYSDGRPGRINYHAEDEYRTITLLVQSTAYDMQDVAHLRDAINDLFDGELMLREMRIKSVEVEYESMGQHTGEMQLESPEYVNGKQIKVTMVNNPEIDDTVLVSTFTVEFETTELPYFETIYTTLELHDSGYSATAEKYGLVDNIDDEKVQYRFTPGTDYQPNLISLTQSAWEVGNWYTTNGTAGGMTGNLRTKSGRIPLVKGGKYTLKDSSASSSSVRVIFILHYNNGEYIGSDGGWELVNRGGSTTFTAKGNEIRISLAPLEGFSVLLEFITNGRVQLKLEPGEEHTGFIPELSRFSVYNAGNVTVEPESMGLEILIKDVVITDKMTIRNHRTSEDHTYNFSTVNPSEYKIKGMMVLRSSVNVFRNTNKRFISLKPGDNNIEITGATFSEVIFNFKYYYK